MLCCAAQSVFAPASNLVFLTWMHLLGGGTLAALMPYIVVSPHSQDTGCAAVVAQPVEDSRTDAQQQLRESDYSPRSCAAFRVACAPPHAFS